MFEFKTNNVELCDFFGKSTASSQKGEDSQEISEQPTLASRTNSENSFNTPINYVSTMSEKELSITTGGGNSKLSVGGEKRSQFEHERLVPFDLSLKTRCRFVSTQPFSCSSAIKSHHESKSMRNFAMFDTFYERLDSARFVNYYTPIYRF